MPLRRLFVPLSGLALLICCSVSSAQTAPTRLELNPCRQIESVKSVVAPNENNFRLLEHLGILQLACGKANAPNTVLKKTNAIQVAACALEIAAGDSFVSAAGVALTACAPDLPSGPDGEEVKRQDALQAWEMAEYAYSIAENACGEPNGSALASQGRLAKAKAFDAQRHVNELIRLIAAS